MGQEAEYTLQSALIRELLGSRPLSPEPGLDPCTRTNSLPPLLRACRGRGGQVLESEAPGPHDGSIQIHILDFTEFLREE